MKKLVLQTILRQWDKSELTELHQLARQALPDCYPLSSSTIELPNNRVLLDQHGDDYSGNRIRYQLIDDYLLIDRFRFNLDTQTIEFKAALQAETPAKLLTTLKAGWIQCGYQWRYRVDEGGFIYWRYESVTLNAAFVADSNASVFVLTEPEELFQNLL